MTILIVKIVIMVLFVTELILLSWADPTYMFSFPFWLDLLSVASFIPDVVLLFSQRDVIRGLSTLGPLIVCVCVWCVCVCVVVATGGPR